MTSRLSTLTPTMTTALFLAATLAAGGCNMQPDEVEEFPPRPEGQAIDKADHGGAEVVYGQGQSCFETGSCPEALGCYDWFDDSGNLRATCEIPCASNAECPSGQACTFDAAGRGICLRPTVNDVPQGEACGSDRHCQSGLSCLSAYDPWLGEEYATCEIPCDPGQPSTCPESQTCLDPVHGAGPVCTPDPETPGDGDDAGEGSVPQGEDCSQASCQSGLTCISWTDPYQGEQQTCEIECDVLGSTEACPVGQYCAEPSHGPGRVCMPEGGAR